MSKVNHLTAEQMRAITYDPKTIDSAVTSILELCKSRSLAGKTSLFVTFDIEYILRNHKVINELKSLGYKIDWGSETISWEAS